MIPTDLKYTREHEWVRVEGDLATVGITAHAVEELGEIVYIELPECGDDFDHMDEFGTVESVKTVSNLYAPIGGTVTDINADIVSIPSNINDSPYEDGWMIKLEISDEAQLDDLMSPEKYEEYLERLK